MTHDTAEMQIIVKRLMHVLGRQRDKMEKRERKGLKESSSENSSSGSSSTLFRKKRLRRKKLKEVSGSQQPASFSLDQLLAMQREMSIFDDVPYFFRTLKQKIICSELGNSKLFEPIDPVLARLSADSVLDRFEEGGGFQSIDTVELSQMCASLFEQLDPPPLPASMQRSFTDLYYYGETDPAARTDDILRTELQKGKRNLIEQLPESHRYLLSELFHLLFLLHLNENRNGLSLQRLGVLLSNALLGPLSANASNNEEAKKRRAITISVMIREHEFFYPQDFLPRFRFETLEDVRDIETQDEGLKNAYARLAGSLLDEEFLIVRVVAQVAKPAACGSLVSAVRTLFENNKLIYSLLEKLVKDHVDECTDQTTLFRKNDLTSALITQFCVHHGKSFLQDTLTPVLRRMENQIEEGFSFALDPSRQSQTMNQDELQGCQQRFSAILEFSFARIEQSLPRMPPIIRHLCGILKDAVTIKFPDALHSAIGGLLFLRFFCPAIVSPESFGLLRKHIRPELRRLAILISKVLQSLSNRSPIKESYLSFTEGFCKEKAPLLAEFYSNACRRSQDLEECAFKNRSTLPQIDVASLRNFHAFIHENMMLIDTQCRVIDPDADILTRMLVLVADLPPPPPFSGVDESGVHRSFFPPPTVHLRMKRLANESKATCMASAMDYVFVARENLTLERWDPNTLTMSLVKLDFRVHDLVVASNPNSNNPTTLLALVNADILYVIDPLSLSIGQVLTSDRFLCATFTSVNQVWCACESGHLLLIHMDTQQETEVRLPNSSHATAICQVNETVWVGTTAGHIYILDLVTAKLLQSIEFAHATAVTDVVAADEKSVWTSAGGQLCVWSIEDFSCLHAFPPVTNPLARLCYVHPYIWLCGAGADWKVLCPDTMKVVRTVGLDTRLAPSGVSDVVSLWRMDTECWELWFTAVCGDLAVVRVSGLPADRPRRRIRYEKVQRELESPGAIEQRAFRGGRHRSLTVDCGSPGHQQFSSLSCESSPRLSPHSPPHLSSSMRRVDSDLGSAPLCALLGTGDVSPSSGSGGETSPSRSSNTSSPFLPRGIGVAAGTGTGTATSTTTAAAAAAAAAAGAATSSNSSGQPALAGTGSSTPTPSRSASSSSSKSKSKHTRSFSFGGEGVTLSPSTGKKKSSGGLKHIKKFSRKRSGSISRK